MTEPATVGMRVLYVAVCVLLPIVWGVLVNWLFTAWRSRSPSRKPSDEPMFPDYQI